MRVDPRHPAHRVTSAHLASAYPFWANSASVADGLLMGRDVCGGGGAFLYDPWCLYESQQLSNPNVAVLGQIGRGKSATVKAYLARSLVLGRRVVVLDRKGEYDRLCEAAGTRPIRLEPGGGVRLNPLDSRLSQASISAVELHQDRLELLVALGGAACARSLRPVETAALRVALERTVTEAGTAEPTIAAVATALLTPRAADAERLGMSAAALGGESRDVALEFDRLVSGDLAGMVDGPTTADVDLDAPLVVFDLSAAARSSAALTVLMVCVAAWAQRLLQGRAGPARRSILVLEEAWACLSNLEVARWLRSLQKLSRQHGVQVIMVLHRLSDLGAAGDEGSEVVRIAAGLLADTETQVVHGMAAAEVPMTRSVLGLSDTEAGLLADLPRGRALWRVRGHSTVVDVQLSDFERWFCDTDASMGSGVHAAAAVAR